MKTLLVATANTPPNIASDTRADMHHRIDYLELARRLGADFIDYGMLGKASPVRRLEEKMRLDIRLSLWAAKLVRENGYECVFSMSERVGIPLTRQLRRSVRHVVLVHHAMSRAKLSTLRMVGAADRWDRMIAISPAEATALGDALGMPGGSVQPLLAAVDTNFYRPPAKEIPLARRDHIQSLGSSHRDYEILLRSLRKLPDVKCEIRLGSTWVRNEVSFAGKRIPETVTLKPFIPPNELREWYARQRFAVITLADDTQWSAGCTSIQHAQAMGRAVIATDRPGLHSYMVEGETGILVRPSDEKDLTEAIDFLWRNPDRADAMGRRGREWVVENCSMERWLDRVSPMVTGVGLTFQAPTVRPLRDIAAVKR